ncbi:hypothetical protein [Mucilaginibacter sp. PPCGB 2223]|uniref:hypothetical protein n=1 Tax=Mucilaginibacter sp. PPCGB 2223 TaxID=1886027 RepID=UPI0008264B42|nr:hypothetical protein [Mucilaginibacter sp. PPCGB 2223]
MAVGQQTQPTGRDLKVFRELLANINATFVPPDGFDELKPNASDKFSCNYALKLSDADFEVRFQVNSLKSDWKNFEKNKGDKINPDSLYSKVAATEVKALAGDGRVFLRPVPPSYLQQYNADLGRSYFFSLADSPETNHYQYGLMVVLQKNHYGNICVACFSNERGPAFFKNINKLKDCIKFN